MKDERKHIIDKLFHESLDRQQVSPSAGVWASLEKHVPAAPVHSLMNYFISAIAIGLLSVGLTILMKPMQEVTSATEQVKQTDALPAEGSETAVDIPDAADAGRSLVPDNSAPAATEPGAHSPSAPAVITQPGPRKPAAPMQAPASFPNTQREDYAFLPLRESSVAAENQSFIIDQTPAETPGPVFSMALKDDYVKKADLLFGAGFSPAVNIYPEGQNRNDFSFELLAAYEKSRFIIEGGIGANYTSESAKYGISYSSYDSVGYFINVNSFGVDPAKPDSVWFETSLKGIYDSIDHYRIEEKTNKYAYLQVPLRIGYRVLEKERFSIDAKLGILFSLQIYNDVPDIPYEGNDVDRINVIRSYPDRMKTNWQYTASVGMNIDISRQLRLNLEPFYRQYIKSVYTSSSDYSARSPHAFGIRGTLYFHF